MEPLYNGHFKTVAMFSLYHYRTPLLYKPALLGLLNLQFTLNKEIFRKSIKRGRGSIYSITLNMVVIVEFLCLDFG